MATEEELIEKLLQAISSRSGSSTRPGQGMSAREQQKAAEQMIKEFKEHSNTLRRQRDWYSSFNNILKGQSVQTEDVTYKLGQLDRAIKDTTDQTTKQKLINERNRVETGSMMKRQGVAAIDFLMDFGKTTAGLARDFTNAGTSMLSSLTAGPGNEFKMFGGLLGGVTKVMAGLGDAAGKTVGGLGELASNFGIFGKIAAVPLQILGKAASALSGLFGAVLPPVITLLTEQMQKTIDAFNNVNRAGAFFAGGMTEMRDTANSAGLTMESYSKVVSANAEGLKNLGGSVANGAKRFADIQRAMLPMRESLMNLGYTIDDQAEGIMQYSNALFVSGQLQNKTATDLAKGAGDYLVNLRLISSITGEDAKRAQQRAREAATQAAVQAKLASMDEQAALKFQALIKVLPPELQKAAQQMLVMGTVTGDAAVALAQVPGLERAIRGAVEGIGDSGQDLRGYTAQAIQGLASVAPEIKRQAGAAGQAIGTVSLAGYGMDAVSGIISAAQRLGFSLQDLSKPENFEKLMKSLEGATNTTDETTKAAASIQNQMNNLQIIVETQITKLMGAFSKVLNDNMGFIEAGIKKLGQVLNEFTSNLTPEKITGLTDSLKNSIDKVKQSPKDSESSAAGGLMGTVGGGLLGALGGKMTIGAIGNLISLIPHPAAKVIGGLITGGGVVYGALTGAEMGNEAGKAAGGMYDTIMNLISGGKALGGPVRGGRTYLVGERGPELFKPESDGEIIPNNKLMSQMTNMLGTADLMRASLEQVRQTYNFGAYATEQLKDIMDDINERNSATDKNILAQLEIVAEKIQSVAQPEITTMPKVDPVMLDIKNALQDQNNMQKETLDLQSESQNILRDLRSIQQQLLHHTV
jgi:hypothetical protein